MPMDLHPYDGVERHYKHTDADLTHGRAIIAQVLELSAPPSAVGLRYDLFVYSGGTGIFDQFAVTFPSSHQFWLEFSTTPIWQAPEAFVADKAFHSLIATHRSTSDLRSTAISFINSERADFQTICRPSDQLLFDIDSGVNDWEAIWFHEGELNYRAFSQG